MNFGSKPFISKILERLELCSKNDELIPVEIFYENGFAALADQK